MTNIGMAWSRLLSSLAQRILRTSPALFKSRPFDRSRATLSRGRVEKSPYFTSSHDPKVPVPAVLKQFLRQTLHRASGRTHFATRVPSVLDPRPHPFDLRYGVDTSGLMEGSELRTGHPNDAFNTAYYGMAPSRLHWIVERWMTQWVPAQSQTGIAQYTFIDLGCGKGRAVMMASQYRFRQVIGVELHPALARIAEQNLALWETAAHSLCPAKILHQDATEFAFPPGPCLLYLFHPFTAPVVSQLIERLQTQFAARSGSLDILYFNPEAGNLFASHPGFQLLWTGAVPLSGEDAAADSLASPEDLCSVFRWIGSANHRT